MLGVPSEIHEQAGIWVWRSRIDRKLASDFAAETREWLNEVKPEGLPPGETYFRGALADEICHSDRLATARVLGLLGTTTAAHGVSFIHRPPGTSDGFHQNCYDSIDVAHGDDGSAVDVSPFATSAEEAEQGSLIIIHFSAGDVIRHVRRSFHQGRNPTEAPQISAAARELPPFGERFGGPAYPRVA